MWSSNFKRLLLTQNSLGKFRTEITKREFRISRQVLEGTHGAAKKTLCRYRISDKQTSGHSQLCFRKSWHGCKAPNQLFVVRRCFSDRKSDKKFTSSTTLYSSIRQATKYGLALIVCGGVALKCFFSYENAPSTSHECQCEERTKQTRKGLETKISLNAAIERSQELINNVKVEHGIPGMVIGVTVNGKDVWQEGFGYSDIENHVLCTPDTVMRIASISKSITMTAVAKLMESGKLDIDKPIQHYLPTFPEKTFNGEKVTITTRQLVSHLGGIRNYEKSTGEPEAKNETKDSSPPDDKKGSKNVDKETGETVSKQTSPFENPEYLLQKHYKSVTDSLDIFQNDPVVHKPGSKFLYTTHGWTLISAVMEKAGNQTFEKMIVGLFKDLGMTHTYLEYNTPIIYNRSRYYQRNEKGKLVNVPYVDLSYKWAGGGMLSTVGDLTKFGNSMLYCYQYKHPESSSNHSDQLVGPKLHNEDSSSTLVEQRMSQEGGADYRARQPVEPHIKTRNPGYLKPETLAVIWTPLKNAKCSWESDGFYAMGWAVTPDKNEREWCYHQRHHISHTGGAVGASSALLILPDCQKEDNPPKGVVVAIITNLLSVGLAKTALNIAKLFENVEL